MPTVPRYVQRETPEGFRNVQRTSGAGSQALANAYGNLGRAIGDAGDKLYSIAITERDRFDKAVCEEAQTAYEDLMQAAKQNEEKRKGKNALGDEDGGKGVHASISQIHADTVTSILEGKNDRQKQYLQDYFNKRGRAFDEWGYNYESGEKKVYEKAQSTAFQQTQIQRAINNPAEMATAMANMETSIREYNMMNGVPDEQTSLEIQAGWDKVGGSIIKNALSRDDVKTATAVLNQFDGRLSAEMVAESRERIKNKQDALQAKAEREAAKAAASAEKRAVEANAEKILEMMEAFPDDWTEDQKAAKLCSLCTQPSLTERQERRLP